MRKRLPPAVISERLHVRQRGVRQRERRGARHRPGHIGHAVVDHALEHIGRLGVGGRAAGFEAAALIDGDIDQHRALLHGLYHGSGDEFRRGGAGDEHRADDEVRVAHQLFDRMRGRIDRVELAGEDRGQFAQPLHRAVDDRDIGAQAHGHLGGVRAGDAAAQNQNLGGRHARHAAQQHSETAVRFLQTVGAHLHGHAAGDFAHGREQRQRAIRRGHRFIRDGGSTRGDERLRLLAVGRQVKIREQAFVRASAACTRRVAAPSPSR